MAAVDEQIPAEPPRKRRLLEAADARHLAVWATDEALSPGARKRAQDERDRRKQMSTDVMVVGVVEDVGGANPLQVETVRQWIEAHDVGHVLKAHSSRSLHYVCRQEAAEVVVVSYGDDAVVDVDAVLGIPTTRRIPVRKDEEFWRLCRKAKDKDIPVYLIWPDGRIQSGRW
jgi:hypothetical protein